MSNRCLINTPSFPVTTDLSEYISYYSVIRQIRKMQDGSGMHAWNYTRLFSAFLNLDDGTQLNYRTTNGFDIEFNTAVCNYDRV